MDNRQALGLGVAGNWIGVHDGDPRALALFKRDHSYRYRASGQPRCSPMFVGWGEVTTRTSTPAMWQYSTCPRDSRQLGVNYTVFRNEDPWLSNDLIFG